MGINIEIVHEVAQEITGRGRLCNRQFRAVFGTDAYIVLLIHNIIHNRENYDDNKDIKLKDLLWALYFLKGYPTEDVAATFLGTTRVTFRVRVWRVVVVLSRLCCTVVSL